jgi:hypothetical protein
MRRSMPTKLTSFKSYISSTSRKIHVHVPKTLPSHLNQSNKFGSSHSPTLQCIKLRSDIQVKIQALAWFPFIFSRVKVNDIFNPRPAPINNPIMSIKWRGIAQKSIKTGFGRHGMTKTAEGEEFGTTTTSQKLATFTKV